MGANTYALHHVNPPAGLHCTIVNRQGDCFFMQINFASITTIFCNWRVRVQLPAGLSLCGRNGNAVSRFEREQAGTAGDGRRLLLIPPRGSGRIEMGRD